MDDLFSTSPKAPLADSLRPQSLSELIGQQHLLGPNRPLRLAFESGKPHSFILWGPPGVGKTTIGRLAAKAFNAEFVSLSAVLSGVKDIRQAVENAQTILNMRGRGTVVFVDEIHRFSASQQDALLPHVESGLFVMIGSTTEHPGMAINAALLSRAQVYQLQPFGKEEFALMYARAQPHMQGVTLDAESLDLLRDYADGDGRRFMNLLEQVSNAAVAAGKSEVDLQFVTSATSPSLRRFDSNGDVFYEQISALHKSIRGSNPNAALYWLARMVDGGVDARYIARRLVVMASEDIGNADPKALQLALNAAAAFERLGSGEGERALAQAAVYLAVAPKSNAVYLAWNEALAFVRADGSRPVPVDLRNAPVPLMKQLGYGAGYRYAHDEPNAYAAGFNYFPEGMEAPQWYRPTDRGLEAKIGQKMEWLQSLDAQAKAQKP